MSINSLIAAIRVAGLNHKQVRSVLLDPKPDQFGDVEYPALCIWPNGFNFSNEKDNKQIFYKFGIGVVDRHDETNAVVLEVCSDTAQILIDIVASLEYIYHGTTGQWLVDDQAEFTYDAGTDKVAGHMIELRRKEQYTRNFCDVPGRDFEFPAVNLTNESVIDEGGPDATYGSILIAE